MAFAAKDQYHVAMIVRSLEAAITSLSETSVRTFTATVERDIQGWCAGELRTGQFPPAFTVSEPLIEHIERKPGTAWSDEYVAPYHRAFWSDDLPIDLRDLQGSGSVREVRTTEDETTPLRQFVCLRDPDLGLRIELVDRALEPVLERIWAPEQAVASAP